MLEIIAKGQSVLGATVFLTLAVMAGCGGDGGKEVEIVAPEAPIPVANPDPKAPMAGINETNEYQHPEALKASIIKNP